MQTCMGPLTSRGCTRNDVTNKVRERYTGTTGMQSTVHGTTTGSRPGSPTNQYQTGVHILARHIRCPCLLKGGFGRIYRTQGVFNRFNGMRASLKLVNSRLFFLNHKIMRPLWFQAEFSYIPTHSIKIMSQTIKTQNIPNSMLCVESGYEYNSEFFFFFFFLIK